MISKIKIKSHAVHYQYKERASNEQQILVPLIHLFFNSDRSTVSDFCRQYVHVQEKRNLQKNKGWVYT